MIKKLSGFTKIMHSSRVFGRNTVSIIDANNLCFHFLYEELSLFACVLSPSSFLAFLVFFFGLFLFRQLSLWLSLCVYLVFYLIYCGIMFSKECLCLGICCLVLIFVLLRYCSSRFSLCTSTHYFNKHTLRYCTYYTALKIPHLQN